MPKQNHGSKKHILHTPKVATVSALCISHHRFSILSIEVDISRGLFQFNIVGIPDKTITDSRFRILSALRNSNLGTPTKNNEKVTISLLPLDTKKRGVYTDLSIAFGYLLASNQLECTTYNNANICCIGNVGLSGEIFLDQLDISHLIFEAYKLGLFYFIVPEESIINLDTLPCAKHIYIHTIKSLSDLTQPLHFTLLEQRVVTSSQQHLQTPATEQPLPCLPTQFEIDNLEGLEVEKRALLIALAGDHHILFIGPPGTGKSALAKSASELLDPLTNIEYLNMRSMQHIYDMNTVLHSNSLQAVTQLSINQKRPVETPHYSVTQYQLIGNKLHPEGIVHRAYSGILILDELAEYQKTTLESLRHRLDVGTTPQTGIVIATSNLCPCGRQSKALSTSDNKMISKCTCSQLQIKKYISKISGPILDRFQITCHLEMKQSGITDKKDISAAKNYLGKNLFRQIKMCRSMQRSRNDGIYNSQLSMYNIKKIGITDEAEEACKNLSEEYGLSNRRLGHIYRVSRTIADLGSQEKIEIHHVYEAFSYIKQDLLK